MNSTFITENLIVFLNKKQPKFLIDNFYFAAAWEMDLVQVTKSDLINEYEIKITKADFKADFKKEKHNTFLSKGASPNRFSFVVPMGLVDVSEVPEYAGLYYVNEIGHIIEIKKPPLLHKIKIGQWFLDKLLIRVYWRYYNLKRKYNSLVLKNKNNGK